MNEQVEFKHDGGHYSWVVVTLRTGNLKVHEAEMVNTHRPSGKQTDATEETAIMAATVVARRRALVAMRALREVTVDGG